ncbi:ketopantoate reductase family protein [Desulfosediminicola sp.]|uniref:ketopantoate reductase family protein n=1 Tax=Desulfosediminicola sp. TaxID=2886825 RepID=UPI003AF2D555
MRIVIVGGGAIGRLFGSYLARGENEVTLLDTDEQVIGAMRDQGIGVVASATDDPDEVTPVPVSAVTDGMLIKECDLVMLMVKSFDSRCATRSVAHLIDANCPLLSIQTGLGNIELMEKVVPKEHILAGFTFKSGTALGGAKVRYGREGKTYLGELNGKVTERVQKIANVFEQCGIETKISQRIIGRLWCKVIVFSAINPLSSLLKVPNGCLTSKMESITLMKRLVDEGRAVAEAYDIDLVYDDLNELLFEACQKSANNLSSMLQDILNDRPTEIDAQNGAICRFAARRGITVPTHETMVELVKLLEKWRPGMEQF